MLIRTNSIRRNPPSGRLDIASSYSESKIEHRSLFCWGSYLFRFKRYLERLFITLTQAIPLLITTLEGRNFRKEIN